LQPCTIRVRPTFSPKLVGVVDIQGLAHTWGGGVKFNKYSPAALSSTATLL